MWSCDFPEVIHRTTKCYLLRQDLNIHAVRPIEQITGQLLLAHWLFDVSEWWFWSQRLVCWSHGPSKSGEQFIRKASRGDSLAKLAWPVLSSAVRTGTSSWARPVQQATVWGMLKGLSSGQQDQTTGVSRAEEMSISFMISTFPLLVYSRLTHINALSKADIRSTRKKD